MSQIPDTAIVLAGGFGTRLRSVISDLPKPMAPVEGQPFLTYLLRYLRYYGIKKVVLCTGFMGTKIREHFTDSFEDIHILYSHEETPLGTGGAIRQALEKCDEKNAVVLNGDSFFDVPLDLFYHRHLDSSSNFSLALRTVADTSRYGSILTDNNNRIIAFSEKKPGTGNINGGIYILDRDVFLQRTTSGQMFSIEKDFFETHLSEAVFSGFIFDGYFIDIGIPDDYAKAKHDFKKFKY